MSSATPASASRAATALAKPAPSVIRSSVNFRQTEVFDRVDLSVARLSIQSRAAQKFQIACAFASARAIRPLSPPIPRAHFRQLR